MPSVAVDGMNVLAVYDARPTRSSARAPAAGRRSSRRRVYRFRAHGGAGDDSHTGYRDVAEREHWEPVRPVALFERLPRARAVCSTTTRSPRMEARIAREIAEAFEFALASPNPTEEDLLPSCLCGLSDA